MFYRKKNVDAPMTRYDDSRILFENNYSPVLLTFLGQHNLPGESHWNFYCINDAENVLLRRYANCR